MLIVWSVNSVKSCLRVRCAPLNPLRSSCIDHICRMDDPLIWGTLPLSYAFSPKDLRWSLGSYDICFQNKCEIPTDSFCLTDYMTLQAPVHFFQRRPSPADT